MTTVYEYLYEFSEYMPSSNSSLKGIKNIKTIDNNQKEYPAYLKKGKRGKCWETNVIKRKEMFYL